MLALTFATYAVTLNGQPVLPRTRAAVVQGHVLLPVRALGEALGADVAYDAADRRILIRRGDRVTTLLAGGSVLLSGGRSYAPLRTVATAFGFGVGYEAAARTIALDDPSRGLVVYGANPAMHGSPVPGTAPRPNQPFSISMTPSDGARVHEPYPPISARFAGIAAIDPSSVQVRLDGRDVTRDAAVIGDQILYTPRSALAPGMHDVRVDARSSEGSPLAAGWSFDDSFAFAPPPPPAPSPIRAVYLDRWVAPGSTAFDVYVRGVPGLNGFVEVEGINGIFPLTVYAYDAYVAHVVVPPALYAPFAHVAARITLPDGNVQTIVLPQTIGLFTPRAGGDSKSVPTPAPRVVPVPSWSSVPRHILSATPTPAPTASPSPRPVVRTLPRKTAAPAATPAPVATPAPTDEPTPTPTPRPHRTPRARPAPPGPA